MLEALVMAGLPLLCGMLLVGYRAWRGDTVALAAMALLALVWLQVEPFEGPVLWAVGAEHGLVAGDLVALVTLGGAFVGYLRTRRRREREHADGAGGASSGQLAEGKR